MKRFLTILGIVAVAATALLSTSCNKPDETAKKFVLTVNISLPAGVSEVSNVVAEAAKGNTVTPLSILKNGSALSATATLPQGDYKVSVNADVTAKKKAVGAGEVSLYEDKTITVTLAETAVSPIIIKAVQYTPGKMAYIQPLSDTWIELVNNSDEVQYLDQIMLFGGMGRQTKPNAWQANGMENLYGGVSADGREEKLEIKTTLSATELRTFMEAKYGSSMFSPQRTAEIERALCSDSHAGCHLLFTYGDITKYASIQNAFEALARQREAAQMENNRKYYQDHLVRNRIAVSKLSGNIRNSVLMHLEPSPIKANTGFLDGRIVWRAEMFEDEDVFRKDEHSDTGNLCVDILLDASTSQKNRQEIISSQGYIIAESLTQCRIPCRVMSFCSMTGYTILRTFREYGKPCDNKKIFDYVSNGCNRDGLAVRAAHFLIQSAPYENKLLIVLSDVKPNDVIKIHSAHSETPQPYETLAGLTDTALEVRRARADGISVICIFTGNDEDVPSAKMVYGKDFVRIQSFDRLADTVGALIQNQIKNM